MQTLFIKNTVSVNKDEYERLKKLDRYFKDFLGYLDYLNDIREARNEVEQGKVVSQEKLFKELGLI